MIAKTSLRVTGVALLLCAPSSSLLAASTAHESTESTRESSVHAELEALVALGESFAALTPGGREESWLAERLNKARQRKTTRPSFVERTLVAAESGQTGGFFAPTLGGVRPRLGGLPSGSGLALGAVYRTELASPSLRMELDTAWSAKGYQKHGVRLGKLDTGSRGALGYAEAGYSHFPREDFYVVLGEAVDRQRVDFALDQSSYGGTLGYRIAPWLATRLEYAFLGVDVGPGTDRRLPNIDDRVDDEGAPGLGQQPDFARWSYSIVADTRDVAGNPHAGGLLSTAVTWFDDRARSDFDFRRVELDGRYYFTLGSRARVLALRYLGSVDLHASDRRVPFYFWPTLGGSRTLRGFSPYRFRGDRLVYFSTEYRWAPVPAVELAVFHDAGRVWRSSAPGDGALERSAGGGIRFKSVNGVVLRVDYGRSREGGRLSVDFGAAF